MQSFVRWQVRRIREVLRGFRDFSYDYYRYCVHAGIGPLTSDVRILDYRLAKTSHALEKSLSFGQRQKSAGWGMARFLDGLLREATRIRRASFEETVARNVLAQFHEAASGESPRRPAPHVEERMSVESTDSLGGAIAVGAEFTESGRLESPEKFFLTRYSVRDFADKRVDGDLVTRALRLAAKAPSACNRQPWHVYRVEEKGKIKEVLSHQNGNRGFGDSVPYLLVIASDLRAFDHSAERYQHWIDGGMFAMSVVLALHSLGLASCCLNWSKSAVGDIRFMRDQGISSSHAIVMMVAVGYAKDPIKICASSRPPAEMFYSFLK